MDATNKAQQQQQNQPRPKLMYIQIPQERVGGAGGGHVKLSPLTLPPPGGTSGLRTAAPHTLALPGGPLGLRTTAPLTLSSPAAASCLRTSTPHTLALRPMPQGSSTLQKTAMKPIPRLTNASFIRVSSPAPIVTGQVVRVATAVTGKSLETKSDASKLCKVSLTPTVATHRITIPGCSRSPQAITITGHNISPKISSPVSSTASRGLESPTINRRILPAPSPSGPIIRVTAPNRMSPSTLTIHPGGKGSLKQLSSSPLANTIQNAAVILSNTNATSQGFSQPSLLSSTGVILSHGKVTALAAPQSLPLQGPATGVPQGIILGNASVPVSVSSIRLWPASSRPPDAVATLVDLTLDKETEDSTGLVTAKPEGLLSEVLMAAGASGIPVGIPRTGQLNNTGLPSTPVILHTPKLPVSSLSAGYGYSMGGGGSSVSTRPVITVPRLRFTTHPTLASLAKKNSSRESFPTTSTHTISSDTPSVSASTKLSFTHTSVVPTARSTPSHSSAVGSASTIPHSSGSTTDTLAPVVLNTNYTQSFSTTPSLATIIPSLVHNSHATSSSLATVGLSPARSKAFAHNAITDAQSNFLNSRSGTLTTHNLFPGASPSNVLTPNVMSCNAPNSSSALFITSQSCITSSAVSSNLLQLSNHASVTSGSSNTSTTSLTNAVPIASVTSSILHPASSPSLSTISAVTTSYKNRSPATDLSRTPPSSCESATSRDTSSSSDRTQSQLPACGTDNGINESALLEWQSSVSSGVGCSGASPAISTSNCNQTPSTESSPSDSNTPADDNITLNIIQKDGKITLQSNIANGSRDASLSYKASAERLKTDKLKPVTIDADILESTTRAALEGGVSSEAVGNLKPLAQMQRKTESSITEGSGDAVSGACEISQTNNNSEEKLIEFLNKSDIDNESRSSSAGMSPKADDADDDISFILCTKSGSFAGRPSSVDTSALEVESKPCDEEDNLRCDEELPDALSNADDDSPKKLEDLRFGELLSRERRDRVIELHGTRLKLKLNEFNALEIDGQVTMEQLKMLSPTSEKGFNLNEVLMHLEKDLAGESVDVLSRFSKEVMNQDPLYTPGPIFEQGSNEYRTEILQRCEEQVNKLFKAANVSLKEKGEAPAIVTISEEDDEVVDCKKESQSSGERPEDERGVVSSTSGSAAKCLDDVTIIGETGRDTGLGVHSSHSHRNSETAPPGQGACAVPVDSSVAGGSDVKPSLSPAEGGDEGEARVCVCAVCGSYGLESEFMRGGQYCSPSCCRQAHDQDSNDTGMKGSKSRTNPDDSCSGKENLFNAQPAETEKDDKEVTYLKEVFNSRSPRPEQRVPFSWVKYLEQCLKVSEHGKAAPLKLWPEPFPCSKNLFQPGMKLEGVDPQHQSLFCVLTVVDVMGHRVKLHFDGYSDVHDFWTNADSPLLFCVGWCECNGRVLSPPPGTARFSWKGYLEHCRAAAAPRQAFATKHVSVVVQTNNIRAGMKLEAEDRKNGWMCVATVKDVMENRLLVHFDGWDSAFDFWTEVNSPYIHPVGWCSENTVQLYAPKDYPNPDSFNWHEYLQETNSVAAPTRSFRTRSPREFKKDMKLEVVDRRNPMLVRVATVVEVHYYQIKVHFDGWDEMYDYWIDDDSPDAHPPSWCSKTGHPLQPPLTSDPSPDAVTSGCGVLGCKGYGHIKGPIYTTHHTAYGCPYSPQNLCKDPDLLIPDRIVCEPERKTRKFSSKAVLLDLGTGNMEDDDNLKKRVRKRRRFFDEISAPESKAKLPKLANVDESGKLFGDSAGGDPLFSVDHRDSESVIHREGSHPSRSGGREEQLSLDGQVHQSVFSSNCLAVARGAPLHNWRHLKHLFEPLQDIDRDKILEWTPEEVEDALLQLSGCSDMSRVFAREHIDGAALLLLTQADLVTLLHIKLGHALKVMAFIDSVRKRLP